MSEDSQDNSEKPFDPTESRLAEQRRKGEIPRSTDLNTAVMFLGMLLVALGPGAGVLLGMVDLGAVFLANADHIAPIIALRGQPLAGHMLVQAAQTLWPLYLVPPLLVLALLVGVRGIVFAPEKLEPKLSRISVISNAKNKFGRSGLFEFAKSCVKLVLICAILGVFLFWQMPSITHSLYLSPQMGLMLMLQLLVQFLALVFVVKLAIGGVDLLWQQAEHLRRNRMSYKEMQDEVKQQEGDPYAKAERRKRGQALASNRMLDAVPEASVVVVNPTHYAVALTWRPGQDAAPVCVAKGVDEMAARIRERAEDAGVPIHSDPPTARALYASVDIDQVIRPEHYAAVAAAIRFAETLRRRNQFRPLADGNR
jgi:flagellar biosynthetic protein FlhB